MSIFYTISRNTNLADRRKVKVYARAQSTHTMSKSQIARYAADHYGVNLDHNNVENIIEMLFKSIIDNLKEGRQVSLGEMGTFYCHLNSESMDEATFFEKGFNASKQIKDVKIKWRPSKQMKSLKDYGELKFQRCSHVEVRKAKLKEAKQRPEE